MRRGRSNVYRFLRRELGSTYLQFIPIVEARASKRRRPRPGTAARLPLHGSPQAHPDHPDSVVTPWSVDADEYGYFPFEGVDEWLAATSARCW